MSHGSVEKCEPNMTPMLDLVLQLVMFFMLCANFLMEDVNPTVKLPSAIQAKPLDKAEEYVIILNVNDKGHLLLGRDKKSDTLTNRIQVTNYMKSKHDADENRRKNAEKRGVPEAKLPKFSLIVLRAHENCTFKQVNEILLACQSAGYQDIQLRAKVQTASR